MPLSPDLFSSICTPAVWVTLSAPETPEHETRPLTVRIQEKGRRSISVVHEVSRYAPEASCLLAVSKMIERITQSQTLLTRDDLARELEWAVTTWVEPF